MKALLALPVVSFCAVTSLTAFGAPAAVVNPVEAPVVTMAATEPVPVLANAVRKADSSSDREAARRALLLRLTGGVRQEVKVSRFSFANRTLQTNEETLPAAEPPSVEDKKLGWEALANSGFGATTGYGYFFHSQRLGLVVQARYNLLRALTSAAFHTPADTQTRAELSPWAGSKISSMAVWAGTTAEKIENRAGTAEEKPVLFGVSVGIGTISTRASAVTFDLGGAIFDNRAFRRIEPFIGVSVDMEVLPVLLSKLKLSSESK